MTNEAVTLPPHDRQAEAGVLAVMLQGYNHPNDIAGVLDVSDFYISANAQLYETIVTMCAEGVPVDMTTIGDRLGHDGLDTIGGQARLIDLITDFYNPFLFDEYVKIVKHKSSARKLYRASNDILNAAFNGESIDDIIATAEKALDEARPPSTVDNRSSMSALIDTIQERQDVGGVELFGVPSAIKALNRLTGGYEKNAMYILAGRPGIGKTSMFCADVLHAAKLGLSVAFVSLEMAYSQLALRLISYETEIHHRTIKTGTMSQSQQDRFIQAAGMIDSLPIHVIDTPSMTVNDILAQCQRIKSQHGLDIVFVDHIGIVKSSLKSDNLNATTTQKSGDLRALAKTLDCPVVVASQLSRAVEQRSNKRPVLADLRDSGSIEQDAYSVMFLYREGYYQDVKPMTEELEIIVAKNRGGGVGTARAVWLAQTSAIKNKAYSNQGA